MRRQRRAFRLGVLRTSTFAAVLLLIGENEVIYDAAKALARARALIPNLEGELVPGANHNMCVSHCQLVDARVLDFLNQN